MGRKYLSTRTIRDDGRGFFFRVVKIDEDVGGGDGERKREREEMERPRRDYEY